MKLRLLSIITFMFLSFVFVPVLVCQDVDDDDKEEALSADSDDNPLVFTMKSSKIFLGPTFGYNRSMHSTSLMSFAEDDMCPRFENGNSHGFFFGLFYEYHIGGEVNSKHTIIGKVLYNSLPASFSEGGSEYLSLLNAGDTLQPVESQTEHTLDISYDLLSVMVLYRFNVAAGFGLVVGPSIDFPIAKTNDQKFMLIEPDNVRFKRVTDPEDLAKIRYEDNDRTIIVKEGDIENATSMRLGLIMGAQYEILLGSGFDIIPGVFYNLGLTDVTEDDDWLVNAIQVGLDIRFAI